jgi:hypothetical protein
MKAKRGTAPTATSCGPAGWNPITKALHLAGYIGCIGPVSALSKAAPVYALTVPYELALDELSFQFNRRGWGYVRKEEFDDALRSDGIVDHKARASEAVDLNRRQTRRRMEVARA